MVKRWRNKQENKEVIGEKLLIKAYLVVDIRGALKIKYLNHSLSTAGVVKIEANQQVIHKKKTINFKKTAEKKRLIFHYFLLD